MKKSLITYILFVFGIVLIIYNQSCTKDSTSKAPDQSNNYSYKDDPLFASLNLAINIAENINKSDIVLKTVGLVNLKSAKYSGKRKIKSSLTILDKEQRNPYFYVLNYESGGFVILSADKRELPIVGYSDTGNFKLDSIPLGLSKWFNASASYTKYLRTSNIQQSALAEYQWNSLQCDESLLKSTKVEECPPPIPPTYSETTITVGPLLNTTWDQGCGYNTYCPIATDGPCGYAVTGCVATAMSQVMKYWQSPSNYSWSTMPSNTGNNAIAHLMRDIGNSVSMNYGGISSGANSSSIAPALKNTFGYSSASFANYTYSSYNTVVSNLNYNEPVLLSGCSDETTILGIPVSYSECHEWVCDGYMQTTYYMNGVETSQYLLFNMNWGWSGSYNGWFYFNQWNPGGNNFQYANDMVYNIHS